MESLIGSLVQDHCCLLFIKHYDMCTLQALDSPQHSELMHQIYVYLVSGAGLADDLRLRLDDLRLGLQQV